MALRTALLAAFPARASRAGIAVRFGSLVGDGREIIPANQIVIFYAFLEISFVLVMVAGVL